MNKWRKIEEARPSFSEEKEAKRLLIPVGVCDVGANAHRNQKFLVTFFQKSNGLLPTSTSPD
jgi:hypothetical protein